MTAFEKLCDALDGELKNGCQVSAIGLHPNTWEAIGKSLHALQSILTVSTVDYVHPSVLGVKVIVRDTFPEVSATFYEREKGSAYGQAKLRWLL